VGGRCRAAALPPTMNRRPPSRPPYIPSPPRTLIGHAHQRLIKMLEDDPNVFNNLPAEPQLVMHDFGTMQSNVMQRALSQRTAMREVCTELIFDDNYYNGRYQRPPERMIRNCLYLLFRNLDTGYINLLFAPVFVNGYRTAISDLNTSDDERARIKHHFGESIKNAINFMRIEDLIEIMRPYRLAF
jgi:hypothetical protein